jgi:hypothetical protein
MQPERPVRAAHWCWLTVAITTGCSQATAPNVDVSDFHLAIPAGPYVPGQSYFGRNQYIEYIAGNAPIILSAPHGGSLTPAEIPDRTDASCGGTATTARDLNTIELALSMQQRYHARYGAYPHVILNRLHRVKLDPNRAIMEAACEDAEAKTAFYEFQDFITMARNAVLQSPGKGWYMDMHGHGHAVQRLELGYLLNAAQLGLSNASLDASTIYEDAASIRTISRASPLSFSALLRGPNSLGTLYESNGFPAVPSSSNPGPGADPYFSGGDNTRRHACGVEAGPLVGGNVCGVQIEANLTGVRDNAANRDRFGEATALVLGTYLSTHWNLSLNGPVPAPTGITISVRGYTVRGLKTVDLRWTGATTTSVDVFRDGVKVITTPNDGAHLDTIAGQGAGTLIYKVCEAGSSTCSIAGAVTF